MSAIKLKGFEEEVTSVNLCPSWEVAAEILMMVLQNPKAPRQTVIDAETEIRRMAKIAAQAVAEQERK